MENIDSMRTSEILGLTSEIPYVLPRKKFEAINKI